LIAFPNCKINLGLYITSKRPDGYHDIETIFLPVSLCDALDVVAANDSKPAPFFQSTGLPIDSDPQVNLCSKAYHLLKTDFPDLPDINVHLHKVIPMGAGLGGGSSDATSMLVLLNKKFQLQLSFEQLAAYALQLGSDCPFFLYNEPCYATGRGEDLTRFAVDLSGYQLLLVCPDIHISTAWAFSRITPVLGDSELRNAAKQPVANWKASIRNQFEEAVYKEYPQLQELKKTLYNTGALYASMTGSGSAHYALFEGMIPNLTLPDSFQVFHCKPGK
jgi:4-diphosphocytidyl-2-C-methyl-D-erythritol kinase